MAYRIDPYDKSIVIDGFENGIATSPFNGLADMRNVDITSIPGETSVNFATMAMNLPPVVSTAFTVNITTSAFASANGTTNWYNGMAIQFTSVGSYTGISTGRVYWVGDLGTVGVGTFNLYKNPSRPAGQQVTGLGGSAGVSPNITSYVMGKPIDSVIDYQGGGNPNRSYMFFLDDAGLVWWVDDTGGVLTSNLIYLGNTDVSSTGGRGIQIFYRNIIVFRSGFMDALDTASIEGNVDVGAAYPSGWRYRWRTISSVNQAVRPTYVGQDNVLYFGNVSQLGSVIVIGSIFDPTDTTTFTYSPTALALPGGDDVVSIAELGVNLLVGGLKNYIYPWNRVSTSFSYPIFLSERNIQRMVTVNTNTFIFVGNRGRIYITNGSQAQFYKKVPDHISGTVSPYYTWGAAGFHRNQLYFSFSVTDNAGNAINQYGGMWAIDLDSKAIRLSNKLSYNTYAGLSTTFLALANNIAGYGMFIGWDSGASTYGIDQSSGSPYTGSQATIDSDLIPIGTFQKPRQMQQMEYKLSRPLVAGESIVIKARLIFNTSDTGYTPVLTDSTVGNYSNMSQGFPLGNAQWIQFQAVLNSTASSPSYVQLRELRILGI